MATIEQTIYIRANILLTFIYESSDKVYKRDPAKGSKFFNCSVNFSSLEEESKLEYGK